MLLLLLSVLLLRASVCTAVAGDRSPSVRVRNGTYIGLYSTTYNQDFFLGMPYAQQPIGNLRFTTPQPLTESWGGVRQATKYSDICVGYGVRL
jgi:triacylglycerol lipase